MDKRQIISFASKSTLEGNTLSGVAHAFGHLAQLEPGRYEQLTAGAFDEVLKTSDVRAFIEHDRRLILGRMSAGTLKLWAEDDGLHYSMDLPDTSYARDLRESIGRDDVTEMSFAMVPGKFDTKTHTDGLPIRVHTQLKELYEISPVTIPAFEGTSAQLSSMNLDGAESIRSQTARARARVLNSNKEQT